MNCTVNASIGMSPYQALYGRDPPNLFDTYARPSHNATVAELLAEREELLRSLKKRLQHAQMVMATNANRHRKDVEFSVGDKVWLRLHPYRQHSVGKPLSAKLGRRFYGPYVITERIGKVAYRLQLPTDSRIHDVFHVSLLRPFVEQPKFTYPALPMPTISGDRLLDTPVRATESRVVLSRGVP
ncbi:uncharacterized protein LOC121796799 [Salvia splendens]|uniref:uncharacterized protein LOC121796799 n=1 Tax=Salvia splendens TaxID=180675 RepID=UPI001C27A1C7|nr:uncharacterized protein LOC121796799 [Salvia splendens]